MAKNSPPKKGPGRPPGAKNRATLAKERAARRAAANGQSPLEFLLEIMRDESRPEAERVDAAKAAAPYCHARLQATTIKEEKANGARDVSTDKLKRLVKAA